jgi:hypothetical protein
MTSRPPLQLEELETPSGRRFVFKIGELGFKARVMNSEPHVAIFDEFNGQPLNQSTLCEHALLLAESALRKRHCTFFYADLGEENLIEFPSPEALASLPTISENMTLRLEVDRYDGPISGLVEHSGLDAGIFWFDWCTESGHGESGRVYSLRRIPFEQEIEVRKKIERLDDLQAELRVLINSQSLPISGRQRKELRTAAQINDELEKLNDSLSIEDWRSLLITAWMPECIEELAAIRVVWMSHEDSARLEEWELNVAQALARNDQSQLDRLFAAPSQAIDENEIYRVAVAQPSGEARYISRDWRGQPLDESFWLTAKHVIKDLSHRLSQSREN